MIRVGGVNATMRLGEREGDWLCHYLAFRAFSIAEIRSSLLVASVRSVPSFSAKRSGRPWSCWSVVVFKALVLFCFQRSPFLSRAFPFHCGGGCLISLQS